MFRGDFENNKSDNLELKAPFGTFQSVVYSQIISCVEFTVYH